MSTAASAQTGAVPKEPHKLQGAGNNIWGNARMKLAKVIRSFLKEKCEHPWFVDAGTLLGAFRSGSFIPHDDDFDFAVFFEERPIDGLEKLLKGLSEYLPSPLECRLVRSYSDKIEVFDPTQGGYICVGEKYGGADAYYVVADLQAYVADKDGVFFPLYRAPPFGPFKTHREVVLPCGEIELEGELFPAPRDPKTYLESIYGSLDLDAVYDVKTGKYVLPESLDHSIHHVASKDSEYDGVSV